MSLRVSRVLVFLAALALATSPAIFSQGIGGSISGRVLDQQNLAVAGASVRILNKATNQSRIVSTDSEGNYEARELPPGLYDVIVEQTGFKPVRLENVRLSVATTAKLQQVTVEPVPLEAERIEVISSATIALTDGTSPTLSTSFSEKQIRELPILSRDLNNLALLAPGVFSVRAFSFANTLVPFAANGSRGRDNNFIIDSVDNNEPLFGGAAAQFTNTDLFAEYRILTNQYKAEYGRNSGSVVNIITERGGNNWHGSVFWYAQHDNFNAQSFVERIASLEGNALFYQNQLGFTVGGPFKKDKTWFFMSYQWDRARNDLSPVFPLIATLPTPAGFAALQPFAGNLTIRAMLANPTVANLPGLTSPCGQAGSGLPLLNPCTVGQTAVFRRSPPATLATNCFVFPRPAGCTGVPVNFGTYLVPRSGVFDVKDHQGSFRLDHQLTSRDDIYFRYLFDDLDTPRTANTGVPSEIAFLDFGLLPEYRAQYKQRTQNLGVFWTHAWPTALHELRLSGTRIAVQSGSLGVDEQTRETVPSFTVVDLFALSPGAGGTPAGNASLLAAFPASGVNFTIGRDSRPSLIRSNLFQLQDNLSLSAGKHSVKLGANFVVTDSKIRQALGDLGQYIYSNARGFGGLDDFMNDLPAAAFMRFTNLGGRGGDVLPLREFAQFYFIQDDIQVKPNLTLSFGMRYENYGQVINRIAEINPAFSPVRADNNNFAPRFGFSWSPWDKFVFRGGYGFYYNPTPFIIPLLAWQSGPVSPLVAGSPTQFFPSRPFTETDVTTFGNFTDCTFTTAGGPATLPLCAASDGISRDLVSPYVQNYSLTMQYQFWKDALFEIAYVGSKATSLFQRVDRNPGNGWNIATAVSGTCAAPPCITRNNRLNTARNALTEVTNGAHSTYNALQLIGTKRISRKYDVAITAAYTWSHMLDNSSEIFGPGVRLLNLFTGTGASEVEAITPFAQDYRNTTSAERGNSAFDRRHRLAISYLWNIPSPESGAAKFVFGGWQFNGFVTIQSGTPFTPINGRTGGACEDARGDRLPTNDRPDVGSGGAAENSVALINNQMCIDPRDFASLPLAALNAVRATNRIGGVTGPDYIDGNGNPTGVSANRFVQVGLNRVGNAGRNILTGPKFTNFDMAILKNFPWGDGRWNLQFRAEAYNVMNSRNPGNPIGNVFSTTAQPVPGIAFLPVTVTPARVIGTIPENALDAQDSLTGAGLFLSRRFMNTSSRHFQFALKLQF